MTTTNMIIQLVFALVIIESSNTISSPLGRFTTYKHSTELQANVADLWWTVDDNNREIMFELHIKTTGWIALGISPAGGMKGADIGVGWVDQTGTVHFQDRYAFANGRPVMDNTTTDWFALRGREESGWTAIQFKRLLDTCDTMDVVIKSGTNILIFAYGLVDPDLSRPDGDITYHENRRGSRIIPLQSYGNPPPEDKFAHLDTFEFRLNNYLIPPTDTTYHCKIYKAPSHYPSKRHAIAHKTLINSENRHVVHHLLMYECDPSAQFDDNNLPDDVCDKIYQKVSLCVSNIATGWAVGGDEMVEFPEVAGYPVGGDFVIKYYMIQMHYDNPHLLSNITDNSGLRFYVGDELRKHDLGYLTLGTDSSSMALAIPPKVERFIVDAYCSAHATSNFPETGITVVSAFPHTHLQGQSVWTKLIRNGTAEQYLFNAEAYDFNYQFENRLPKPVTLYRGDEFATRCVYNTMNKDEITLGGERTKDEMCLHIFTYYPRMNDLYGCMMYNSPESWAALMNQSLSNFSYDELKIWQRNVKWTPELAVQWQEHYNNVSRVLIYGRAEHFQHETFPHLPEYTDLKPEECTKQPSTTTASTTIKTSTIKDNSAFRQKSFILLTLIPFFIKQMFVDFI